MGIRMTKMTTTRLRTGEHLTSGHAAQLTEQMNQTFEGMAHFAGSGPFGARCRNCRFWDGGAGRNRSCAQFRRMTGVKSKLVPGYAEACKYFNQLSRGNDH
jgi:hypothetical protein